MKLYSIQKKANGRWGVFRDKKQVGNEHYSRKSAEVVADIIEPKIQKSTLTQIYAH